MSTPPAPPEHPEAPDPAAPTREAEQEAVGPVAFGPGDALLVVDLQHDFLPGGALGVPEGDRVLEPIGRLVAAARRAGVPVALSRDEHPEGHCSFAEQGGPWPPHCVRGTHGAELHPSLETAGALDVPKGREQQRDAYSAFDGTDLAARLGEQGVRRAVVCGLATDYCVRATALDAREAGLEVVLVPEAMAAVDVQPGDGERSIAELRAAGATLGAAPA